MERMYQSYVQGVKDVTSIEWNLRGKVFAGQLERGVFRKNLLRRKALCACRRVALGEEGVGLASGGEALRGLAGVGFDGEGTEE